MISSLVCFEIAYETSDSNSLVSTRPTITKHTRPTYSMIGARARAAEKSNAIGFKSTPNAYA